MTESTFFEELFDKVSDDLQEEAKELLLGYFIEVHQLTGTSPRAITTSEWLHLQNLLMSGETANQLIAIQLLKGFQLSQKDLMTNLSAYYEEIFSLLFESFSTFFGYIDKRMFVEIRNTHLEKEMEALAKSVPDTDENRLELEQHLSELKEELRQIEEEFLSATDYDYIHIEEIELLLGKFFGLSFTEPWLKQRLIEKSYDKFYEINRNC